MSKPVFVAIFVGSCFCTFTMGHLLGHEDAYQTGYKRGYTKGCDSAWLDNVPISCDNFFDWPAKVTFYRFKQDGKCSYHLGVHLVNPPPGWDSQMVSELGQCAEMPIEGKR